MMTSRLLYDDDDQQGYDADGQLVLAYKDGEDGDDDDHGDDDDYRNDDDDQQGATGGADGQKGVLCKRGLKAGYCAANIYFYMHNVTFILKSFDIKKPLAIFAKAVACLFESILQQKCRRLLRCKYLLPHGQYDFHLEIISYQETSRNYCKDCLSESTLQQ